MGKKYKVTNVTIQPPKIDQQTGRDTRTALEKVGHPVSIRSGTDRITLYQRGPHSVALVGELSEGLCRMARAKPPFVKIEEVEDIVTALKNHTLDADGAEGGVGSRRGRRAAAVEMGKDTHEARSTGSEYEGAINPSGDPNFLVNASKTRRKRGPKASK